MYGALHPPPLLFPLTENGLGENRPNRQMPVSVEDARRAFPIGENRLLEGSHASPYVCVCEVCAMQPASWAFVRMAGRTASAREDARVWLASYARQQDLRDGIIDTTLQGSGKEKETKQRRKENKIDKVRTIMRLPIEQKPAGAPLSSVCRVPTCATSLISLGARTAFPWSCTAWRGLVWPGLATERGSARCG
ncbi:hypothetical protein LZ31DRAFT_299448 [Colletotrichum somersetense]|nr:hypothetical protein LZ31DRAFT_299448 [Colletotrichum somersetense]